MKAITLYAGATQLPRKRNQLRDCGLCSVKAGVEARHLRHTRQSFTDGLDRREIVRLMQRRQRYKPPQFRQHFGRNYDRAGIPRGAMHNPVSDAEYRRRPIFRSKPHRKGPQGGADVLHFAREPAIDQNFPIGVFDGNARRYFDAFDLAPRR